MPERSLPSGLQALPSDPQARVYEPEAGLEAAPESDILKYSISIKGTWI
jgi:hypothetical protein